MTNHDELCEKDKEIKELRTRVADWRADAVKHAQEVLELRARLSTLLKASEGIEKALELLINHTMDCEEDIDKLSGMGNDSGSGSSEYVCAAKQALADFRAVKEGK